MVLFNEHPGIVFALSRALPASRLRWGVLGPYAPREELRDLLMRASGLACGDVAQ